MVLQGIMPVREDLEEELELNKLICNTRKSKLLERDEDNRWISDTCK